MDIENPQVKDFTERLCEAIKQSREYNNYVRCLEELKKDPTLYEQVCALRKNNFMVQNGMNGRMSYHEYHDIYNSTRITRQNSIANSFLDAELDFARMMQSVNDMIIGSIDFDIDFLD